MSRYERDPALCVNCHCPASGRHALPVGDNGDIVPVGYAGEWGGQPACKMCHDLHVAAGDNAEKVLAAYEQNTMDMYNVLESTRKALQNITNTAEDAEAELLHMAKSGPRQ